MPIYRNLFSTRRERKVRSGGAHVTGSGGCRRTGLFFAAVSRQLVRDNWSADALEP